MHQTTHNIADMQQMTSRSKCCGRFIDLCVKNVVDIRGERGECEEQQTGKQMGLTPRQKVHPLGFTDLNGQHERHPLEADGDGAQEEEAVRPVEELDVGLRPVPCQHHAGPGDAGEEADADEDVGHQVGGAQVLDLPQERERHVDQQLQRDERGPREAAEARDGLAQVLLDEDEVDRHPGDLVRHLEEVHQPLPRPPPRHEDDVPVALAVLRRQPVVRAGEQDDVVDRQRAGRHEHDRGEGQPARGEHAGKVQGGRTDHRPHEGDGRAHLALQVPKRRRCAGALLNQALPRRAGCVYVELSELAID